MTDQHDRQLATALGHRFGQPLQRGQRLGMQVVRVVNEQRHGLLGAPERLLQVALPPFQPA